MIEATLWANVRPPGGLERECMLYQPPIPSKYTEMRERDLIAAIADRKQRLGRRLVILGHHYQHDDVIQFADFTGDSLKLAKIAAAQTEAEFVIFCGVHFMAETADMLTSDDVHVILPDLAAGCSMADMAEIDQVEDAWERLTDATDAKIVPITYVNSAANIKAFCGGRDGACCTSSNAPQVLEWALRTGEKVLFLPDQHLGRNTAYMMGYPLDSMVVYDPHQENGGLTDAEVADARFILWRGHCSVHQLFTPEQCDQIRAADPAYQILVHPEVPWEVVQKADLAGSTEFIVKTVAEAPAGTKWAVGTEVNLVNRLTKQYADTKVVRSLAGVQCLCTTMYRIDMPHLLHVLDNLVDGRIVNQIHVDPETTALAILALNRMLANVSARPVAIK
ncbi:MAG: quinolinate synthase NadA [Phycisphaerae bacterium]|nr:quinolinate synthase NadA [Phycisphaerae bacterium]